MRLIFKQRFFSWLDSYDIYDEYENKVFTVEGKFGFGRRLHIYDASGAHIATMKQKVFSIWHSYALFRGEEQVGTIKKEITFFKPVFTFDCNGWEVNGNFFEWDYEITDHTGKAVATISKKIMNWTDTYVLDVYNDADAVTVLMVALAIDAEKASRN